MSNSYMAAIGRATTGNACQKATACSVYGLVLSLSGCKLGRKLLQRGSAFSAVSIQTENYIRLASSTDPMNVDKKKTVQAFVTI